MENEHLFYSVPFYMHFPRTGKEVMKALNAIGIEQSNIIFGFTPGDMICRINIATAIPKSTIDLVIKNAKSKFIRTILIDDYISVNADEISAGEYDETSATIYIKNKLIKYKNVDITLKFSEVSV